MYKIMESLNSFNSETACPIFTKFHMTFSVSGGWIVCSHAHALFNKMSSVHIYIGKCIFFFFFSK